MLQDKEEELNLDELTEKGYRILAVDSQIVSSITICEKRTELRFLKRLELIEEGRADYLDRGSLLHLGLKVHNTLSKRTDKFSFKDRQEIAISLMRKQSITLDVQPLEAEEYVETFLSYTTFRKEDGWIPVFIEEPFSKLLFISHEHRIVILYEGVIDLIKEGFRGNLDIVDYKGMKRRYPPLDMTFQFLGYCWATGNQTIIADQVGFQKTLKPEQKFIRSTFSYTQENLDEWRINVIKILMKWIGSVDADDFLLSLNGLACNSFNRLCPYYKYYCKAAPSAREWNLSTKYRIGEEWSPWTRDDAIDKILEELLK